MTRSSSVFLRLGQSLLAAALVVAMTPATALAADPPTTPRVLKQESFEGVTYGYVTPPSGWAFNRLSLDPIRLGQWGAMNESMTANSVSAPLSTPYGSQFLWCSGIKYDVNTGVIDNTPSWGKYIERTGGRAVLNMSALDDQYYSELEFYYNMPSLGSGDAASFAAGWTDGTNPNTDHFSNFALTAKGSWIPVSYVLTDSDNNFNMSRAGGEVYFNFIELEGDTWIKVPNIETLDPDDYKWVYTPAKTAQGTSIDNVTVKAYRYGPVRDLVATGSVSDVTLSWAKPYEAVGSSTVDGRSLTYRIWQAIDGANPLVWTELTSSAARLPDGTVSYVDTPSQAGVTYRYLVQAWDVGAGSQYGEPAQTTGRLLMDGLDAEIQGPTAVLTGQSANLTYHVQNTGDTTLTSIVVTDNWSGTSSIPPIASLSPKGQPGYYVDIARSTPALTSGTNVTLTATASGVTPSATDSQLISVYNPKIDVTVAPSSTTVVEGVTFRAAYTIKNTGNTKLTNIRLSSGLGGDLLGLIASLDSGESETLYRDTSLSSSGYVSAYVTADYSAAPGLSGTVSDTGKSAQITVIADTPPVRIAGTTRITTAVDISKEAFPGGLDGYKAVVLANSDAWADALPASALAGAVQGPLMLSGTTSVSGYVMSELTRLGAEKVYLVGGEAVLSPAVKTQLINAGYSVTRLGGNTRYDTAQLISAEVNEIVGRLEGGTVFLVTGTDFPDALSASSLASKMAAPILLTKQDAIPSATDKALQALQPDKVVVCGGTNVVSDAVLSSLYVDKYGKPIPVRKAGADRYATAQIVNQYGADALLKTNPEGVFVATGTNYPDALAGGVIAGIGAAQWRPLMLTKPTALSSATKSFISANESIQFYSILGGTSAVSSAVEAELKSAVSAN